MEILEKRGAEAPCCLVLRGVFWDIISPKLLGFPILGGSFFICMSCVPGLVLGVRDPAMTQPSPALEELTVWGATDNSMQDSKSVKSAVMGTRGAWGCNGRVLNELGRWDKGEWPHRNRSMSRG